MALLQIKEKGVFGTDFRMVKLTERRREVPMNDALLIRSQLESLASKYVWWEIPAEAADRPQRVMAQVMNIGDYADVQRMVHLVGQEALRDVIAQAQAGQFNDRSWTYWHYRLGLCELEAVPPLPQRSFT
jgi:hypothetical protein